MADQSIKNLEDQQDEYDFKINTLKNRGEWKTLHQTEKHTRYRFTGEAERVGSKATSVFL